MHLYVLWIGFPPFLQKNKPKPQKPKPLLLLPGIEAEEVDLAFEGGPGHVVAIDAGAEAKLKKTNLKVVFLRVWKLNRSLHQMKSKN